MKKDLESEEIKVMVVDDHRIVLDGLCSMLEDAQGFRCVATLENGQAALDRLKLIKVDVVLMDIDMPVMDGIEATIRIKRTMPDVKVISLTHHNERAMVQRLMDCGSDGYMLKNIDRDGLLDGIRKVIKGQRYFSEEVTRKLAEREVHTASSGAPAELTEREAEILRHICEGLSSKQIGEMIFISPRTVDTHRTNLMNKLDIHNVAGLIRFAFQNGIIA
ncbi:MAG: response regulator transcription factor [Flavobacteriales bacterium]|nr:response regulator transcription factor [Flavobacteriales bacterium]